MKTIPLLSCFLFLASGFSPANEILTTKRVSGVVSYPATTIVNAAIFETDGSGNVVMTPKSVYATAASLTSYAPLAGAVFTGAVDVEGNLTASNYFGIAASMVGVSPVGGISAEDVQGALGELDSNKAPVSTTVTLTGTQTLTNKSISSGQITGLGALATVTPGTNVATSLAIAADATGGIFRQGQALSGTTGTFSGAVRTGTATTADALSDVLISTSATTQRGLTVQGKSGQSAPMFRVVESTNNTANNGWEFYVNEVYWAGSGNRNYTSAYLSVYQPTFAFKWSSSPSNPFAAATLGFAPTSAGSGILEINNGTLGTLRDASLRNLTASGTVTAAQYLYTAALFVTESTTARTLTSADHGKTIVCTNAGAVAITLNTGLPTCFFVTIIQKGTGQVTVSGSATLEVFTGFAAKTAGQHAQMSVSNYGTSNVYHVAGQLGT